MQSARCSFKKSQTTKGAITPDQRSSGVRTPLQPLTGDRMSQKNGSELADNQSVMDALAALTMQSSQEQLELDDKQAGQARVLKTQQNQDYSSSKAAKRKLLSRKLRVSVKEKVKGSLTASTPPPDEQAEITAMRKN